MTTAKRIKLDSDDGLGERVRVAQLNAKIHLQLQSTAHLQSSLQAQCEGLRDELLALSNVKQLAIAESQAWLRDRLSMIPELKLLADRLTALHDKLIILQSRKDLLNETIPAVPTTALPVLQSVYERVSLVVKRNELRQQVARLEGEAAQVAKQVKMVRATRHRQSVLAIFNQ